MTIPTSNILCFLLLQFIFTDAAPPNVSPTNTLSGNYFIFCFPTNRGPRHIYRTMSIQLHSASHITNVTNVNLGAPGIQWSFQVTLGTNEVKTVIAPGGVEANSEETLQIGTITITSDHNIYVTAISDVEGSLATIPVPPFDSASGNEFFVANYQPAPIYPSQIVLTASTSTATVVVKKHQGMSFNDLVFPGDFQYSEYNDVIRFLLPANQSVQLHCEWDCTGLKITTDIPISLLSGGQCTFVTNHDFHCDHIAAFIPSVDRLGEHFTMGPFMGRESGYIARVVATQNETNVTISSLGTLTMNAGQYYDEDIKSNRVIVITSTKPIVAVQFAKGYTSDGKLGDPFMIIVPPQEQYVNAVTFADFDTLDQYELFSYLNIIIDCKHVDDLLFNGERLDWERYERESYMCVIGTDLISPGINRITHRLNKARFAAFIYGFGEVMSYGHALDHQFTHISEPVVPSAYCPEDETEDDALGNLQWPRTKAGIIAQSNQRCPLNSERGKRIRDDIYKRARLHVLSSCCRNLGC